MPVMKPAAKAPAVWPMPAMRLVVEAAVMPMRVERVVRAPVVRPQEAPVPVDPVPVERVVRERVAAVVRPPVVAARERLPVGTVAQPPPVWIAAAATSLIVHSNV